MSSFASSAVSSAVVCEGSVAMTGRIAYLLSLLMMRNVGCVLSGGNHVYSADLFTSEATGA